MSEPKILNCVVYQIFCLKNSINKSYVGCSSMYNRRKIDHKRRSRIPTYKDYNYKLYKYIRRTGGFDNWDFIILEKFQTTSNIEKRKTELKWIKKLKPELNQVLPYVKHKTIKKRKKDSIKKKSKILINSINKI